MSEAASGETSAEVSDGSLPATVGRPAPADAAAQHTAWQAWAADLPLAMLLLDAHGRPVWANAAFGVMSGLPLSHAEAWAACPAGDARPLSAADVAVACRVQRQPLPGGATGVRN